VPHLVGVLRQRDALELALAAGVEQAELDALGVLREEREVDAAGNFSFIRCRLEG
jgi:hypothetical protein